ncbi:MAG: hypothetical protein H0T83_03465 [Chthoniobacterales bacterium]|nr:hypothetical protein [Chthoniobacterales bacterium]
MGEEFKAFVFAWEGSINFAPLASPAMSKERFLETFGLLTMTLRLPFSRNVVDDPEMLRSAYEEHPLFRVARSKYTEGSVEEMLVFRFLNAEFNAEEIARAEGHSVLAERLFVWVGDARSWAERLLQDDPQMYMAMFEENENGLQDVRVLFRSELGSNPSAVDDQHATGALIGWAKRRGFDLSGSPVEIWTAVLEIVDAALWLGWLFPRLKPGDLKPVPDVTREGRNLAPMGLHLPIATNESDIQSRVDKLIPGKSSLKQLESLFGEPKSQRRVYDWWSGRRNGKLEGMYRLTTLRDKPGLEKIRKRRLYKLQYPNQGLVFKVFDNPWRLQSITVEVTNVLIVGIKVGDPLENVLGSLGNGEWSTGANTDYWWLEYEERAVRFGFLRNLKAPKYPMRLATKRVSKLEKFDNKVSFT